MCLSCVLDFSEFHSEQSPGGPPYRPTNLTRPCSFPLVHGRAFCLKISIIQRFKSIGFIGHFYIGRDSVLFKPIPARL